MLASVANRIKEGPVEITGAGLCNLAFMSRSSGDIHPLLTSTTPQRASTPKVCIGVYTRGRQRVSDQRVSRMLKH